MYTAALPIPGSGLASNDEKGRNSEGLDEDETKILDLLSDDPEPVHIDADYDPRMYLLHQANEKVDGVPVLTVELRPTGSKLMALLRAKLGGRLAMLRIALPRDVPLVVDGHLVRSFAAMELGGLSLASARLSVEEGGVKVSFVEPLPELPQRLHADTDVHTASSRGVAVFPSSKCDWLTSKALERTLRSSKGVRRLVGSICSHAPVLLLRQLVSSRQTRLTPGRRLISSSSLSGWI